MPDKSTLSQQLVERFAALDARPLTPPIEVVVEEYAFYPYRGFSDISQRDDFRHLTKEQLHTLIKIADDLLAMQRPELFDAFVNDDGILVIDPEQEMIEYSIDIDYNASHSRVREVYPQVAFPYLESSEPEEDDFHRNDLAHEMAHHADFWVDHRATMRHLLYMHSSSTLLAWLEELDILLHPDGVAALIQRVRNDEGYVPAALLENGHAPARVDEMLRAEFFAIAGEFYYGSRQPFKQQSPLLEAYMRLVLDTDLEIQNLIIPFAEMERRRKVLRDAIHAKLERLLRRHGSVYHELRRKLREAKTKAEATQITRELEKTVIQAMEEMATGVRERAKLPPL